MKFFVLLIFLGLAFGQKAKFYNYRLHKLTPQTSEHVTALQNLYSTNEYIFLTFPTKAGRDVNIVVPPHLMPDFENFVNYYKIPQVLRMENYQSLLDEEEKLLNARPKKMEWSSYHNLDEIYKWMDDLATEYPFVKKIVAGKTYEGREIRGIEIIFGEKQTGVFIESGIHACEWIGPAGTSWVINEILKSPKNSTFRKFNYIYFPIFNPDGYVYSWNKYRLWRKTRTLYKTQNKLCYGADPNRNWGYHWNEGGSTLDPCSSTYAGPKAFSELETSSLSKYIASIAKPKRIDIYLAFHSYYQLILLPWGFTPEPPPNYDIQLRIAKAAAADLTAVHGTQMTVGSGYKILWSTSGSSGDWIQGNLNTTLTFLFEMRDTGHYGFVLPAKNIIPVGQEHLPAIHRILTEYQKLNISKYDKEVY